MSSGNFRVASFLLLGALVATATIGCSERTAPPRSAFAGSWHSAAGALELKEDGSFDAINIKRATSTKMPAHPTISGHGTWRVGDDDHNFLNNDGSVFLVMIFSSTSNLKYGETIAVDGTQLVAESGERFSR
jgi:hypothetical protein